MSSRTRSRVATSLAVSLLASAALAAEPEEQCAATKLKLSGKYAACRSRAAAKAGLKGTDLDFTKCEDRFAKQFGKAEEKAGPGLCPTENDVAVIDATVARCTADVAVRLAADGCPEGSRNRTPLEVVADTQAAISAGDAQAIACNYEEAAVYINDQGVDIGRDDIVASHLNLVDIFGSYDPVISLTTSFDDTVRVLFSFDIGWALIEDGCDTFQVEAGRIQRHVRHGFIELTGPPPS